MSTQYNPTNLIDSYIMFLDPLLRTLWEILSKDIHYTMQEFHHKQWWHYENQDHKQILVTMFYLLEALQKQSTYYSWRC